jgi:hypothetical protein
MSEIAKDAGFRGQYERSVETDAEFEAALSGAAPMPVRIAPAAQPIGGHESQWLSPNGMKLR